MGHTDLLVIADAGLPVPTGVPPFFALLDAIAAELEVEALTVAGEALARDRG